LQQEEAFEKNSPFMTSMQRALMEPPWKGNAGPGEEGGRPDIAALCAAELGGLPLKDATAKPVHSMARI
jgi:hypothetical protein